MNCVYLWNVLHWMCMISWPLGLKQKGCHGDCLCWLEGMEALYSTASIFPMIRQLPSQPVFTVILCVCMYVYIYIYYIFMNILSWNLQNDTGFIFYSWICNLYIHVIHICIHYHYCSVWLMKSQPVGYYTWQVLFVIDGCSLGYVHFTLCC